MLCEFAYKPAKSGEKVKVMKKILIAAFLFASMSSAHAALIKYQVSDANNNSGNSIGHGLYTFGKNGTGAAAYSISVGEFIIDDQGTASSADDTGSLTFNASNGSKTAVGSLTFTDFAETNAYKQEQGRAYTTADDLAALAGPGNLDVDFFESIAGTIDIDGTVFQIQQCVDCPDTSDPFGLQFGDGANAKSNSDFGGSAWIGVGPTFDKASHWDLNLTFTEMPVPAPSVLMLFGLGLVALGRRSRRD